MENDKRISIDGISSVADLVNAKMEPQRRYTYEQFWRLFVYPSELDCHLHKIDYWNTNDRHAVKKGVNEEFGKRRIPKVLFAAHNEGFYLLDETTGVAAKRFLEGVKKWASACTTHVERSYLLAEGDDLTEDDKRLLRNTAGRFDDNKSALAGTIGRMRSIPIPVKIEAMRLLGVSLDGDESQD
jgi:hypothetical protein